MHRTRSWMAVVGLACVCSSPASAATTAFRIADLDLRDPHVFVDFLGCRDLTDNALLGYSFNSNLQSLLQTDADTSGTLDLSYLIVFDPLDPSGSGGSLLFGRGTCTAPVTGSACAPESPLALTTYSYTHPTESCLGIVSGTTRPYTPAVTLPTAPCFVADLGTLHLEVGLGVPLTLRDARLAATYEGDPQAGLIKGLIRGFVTEADANNSIIPSGYALFGGQPVSSILPGGNGCCASISDEDVGPEGGTGWYFYFNFSAVQVSFDAPTAVPERVSAALELEHPVPNPFNPQTTIRYTLAEAALVRLEIHDARGRRVALLAHGARDAGEHAVSWTARDESGQAVGSGVYFVRLQSRGESHVRKIVLLE